MDELVKTVLLYSDETRMKEKYHPVSGNGCVNRVYGRFSANHPAKNASRE